MLWSHRGALAFSRVNCSSLRSCLGCPTHRWLTLFALPMDRRTRNSFDNYGFVFRRWYRGCNLNRIAISISWIALGSFVFARCGGYEKLWLVFVPATALSSRRFFLVCFLQNRRHACEKVYPADTSQWSWIRHTLIAADTTDNSESINTVDTSIRYFLIITQFYQHS